MPTSFVPLRKASARTAFRELGLRQLDRTQASFERLCLGAGENALHDFRVAVRRLRCLIGAYRHLHSLRRPLRRLQALMRETSSARDKEISIRWLGAARSALQESHRIGLMWLNRSLTDQLSMERIHIKAYVGREWPDLHDELVRKLRSPRCCKKKPSKQRFARTTARRVQQLAQRLQGQLFAVHDVEDIHHLHAARITVKKLRYLLEPYREQVTRVEEQLPWLTEMQDDLGLIHDLDSVESYLRMACRWVSAERAEGLLEVVLQDPDANPSLQDWCQELPGLLAAARLVQTSRRELFRHIEELYLGDRMAKLVHQLADAGVALMTRKRHQKATATVTLDSLPAAGG